MGISKIGLLCKCYALCTFKVNKQYLRMLWMVSNNQLYLMLKETSKHMKKIIKYGTIIRHNNKTQRKDTYEHFFN